MLELALKGGRSYWAWVAGLLGLIVLGLVCYSRQWELGLVVTGQSRDVSWGFYTAQMTFLVGVAAGGVMLVLPYYLHDYKVFGKITVLGEFLAVASLVMCLLFLFIHLGQPSRALNIFLNATPGSMLFWDGNVLSIYLILNVVIGWKVLEAERNGVAPPGWVRRLVYLSIPMAFAIHTMTAFIYCGLPGRGFWMTAILAPRFLASAFASGPALLILLCLFFEKRGLLDVGSRAVQSLAVIATYGLCANLFFLMCEVFVAFYSGIPEHTDHLKYLYVGLHGRGVLVSWMRLSLFLLAAGLFLFLTPKLRRQPRWLAVACLFVFLGTWIDKGLGMIAGGFTPSPLHHVTEYVPTLTEVMVGAGVVALGLLVLTLLYKIALTVKR